jgi:hypothetical protein
MTGAFSGAAAMAATTTTSPRPRPRPGSCSDPPPASACRRSRRPTTPTRRSSPPTPSGRAHRPIRAGPTQRSTDEHDRDRGVADADLGVAGGARVLRRTSLRPLPTVDAQSRTERERSETSSATLSGTRLVAQRSLGRGDDPEGLAHVAASEGVERTGVDEVVRRSARTQLLDRVLQAQLHEQVERLADGGRLIAFEDPRVVKGATPRSDPAGYEAGSSGRRWRRGT